MINERVLYTLLRRVQEVFFRVDPDMLVITESNNKSLSSIRRNLYM